MKKIILFLFLFLLFLVGNFSVNATTTEHKILLILVNFQDTDGLKNNRDDVVNITFNANNSIANFYNENSYGQIHLSGDVFPSANYQNKWYELAMNYNCDLTAISLAATQALETEEGNSAVDFLAYDHLMIVMPNGDCGRGASYIGTRTFATPDGNHTMTLGWVADNTIPWPYGIGHELGHGFGSQHAGMYKCNDIPYSASGCEIYTVQDLSNIMSVPLSRPGQFSAVQKDTIGFFDSQHQLLEVDSNSIVSNGTYELTPFESSDPGLKAIKIKRNNGKFWYLEFRQPIGFDANLGAAPDLNGILIHTNNPGQYTDSILIDASPVGEDFSWNSAVLKEDTPDLHTGSTGFYDPEDQTRVQVLNLDINEDNPALSRAIIKITLLQEFNPSPPLTPIEELDTPVEELVPLPEIDLELSNRLKGKILLQVENHGEAWYVRPDNGKRMYMKDGSAAYGMMRNLGLGISNVDLAKIPVGIEDRFECVDNDNDGLCNKLEEGLGTDPNNDDSDNDGYKDGVEVNGNYNPLGLGNMSNDSGLVNRLKGQIVLQVQSRGEAWYINPDDGKRYYMRDGEAAYQIMRFLSLGITNNDLNQIDTE
ncbi:hypothetical protein KKH39_00405 [Patescibacteria group bacterium]|nr:hypothetical protein [Patescibacteria group bacterium]